MKRIEHKHGKRIYMIFEAELNPQQKLAIVPDDICCRLPGINSHAIEMLNKVGNEWNHGGEVEMPIGKLGEFGKILKACIKDSNKTLELQLDERHHLRIGPEGYYCSYW